MGEGVVNRIRDYRLKIGITQEELAESVGVSRQSIISIERGRYMPSLYLALRFSKFFHCSTDELFMLREEG
jgi:putative transcriptional regulator